MIPLIIYGKDLYMILKKIFPLKKLDIRAVNEKYSLKILKNLNIEKKKI